MKRTPLLFSLCLTLLFLGLFHFEPSKAESESSNKVLGHNNFSAQIAASRISRSASQSPQSGPILEANGWQSSIEPVGPIATDIFSSAGPGRVQGSDKAFARLITKAESEGLVRIIVGLNTAFSPEGFLQNAHFVESQRKGIGRAQDSLIEQLAGSNARSLTRFTSIPFIAMELDAAGLKFLQKSREVSSIEEDLPRPIALAESVPLVGGTAAWASGFSGAGQTIAILDSGVDKTHSFLSGKVVSEACYSTTNASFTSICPGGVTESTSSGSGVNCSVSLNSDCAHGTHVAGIAAGKGTSFSGVAKDANIIAIQVFSQPVAGGSLGAFDSNIISGLQRVQQLSGSFNIAAVNMSLGGAPSTTNCDGFSPAMKAAIDNLRSINIATVIASGNAGSTTGISYPACISTAISVGSTDDGSFMTTVNAVSSFSNSASFLKLLAPGRWINSSVPNQSFQNFSGTSMAAPHVAGAWAVLRSKAPSATVDQVLQALTSTGLPVTDPRNGITKPRIKVDAALNALDPTSGLVGFWKFDENAGTTAADSSGSGHTGTLTSGAGWGTGQIGSAVSLDGVDDYVQVGSQSSLVLTNNASFTAWIHPTGPGSQPDGGGIIISKEGEYEIARFADGTIRWAFANTSPGWNWITGGVLTVAPLNQWTHVAVVYESGIVKTYINGVLMHTFNGSGAIGDIDTTRNDFRIGGRQLLSQNFQGRIDEVRVYNRAITASEITELMGEPIIGLKGYWKFDENTGTTAADSTGNGNTATLTSGAGWGTGQIGSAVSLDGVDDYVHAGSQFSLVVTNNASFTAWIHPTGPGSLPDQGGIIISKEGEYEIARFADGTIRWAFANTSPGWNWITGGVLTVAPLNQWTHVAVVYESGIVKTYINGVLMHTFNGSGAIGDIDITRNDFRIGGRQLVSQNFQGRIDEVRVYNQALSASEITQLMGEPTIGLKGYWKFDENTGTTAADSSGNGNTGTLTAGAGWGIGQNNSAVSLDGVDDYVYAGSQFSLVMTNNASFTAWIHPTGPGSHPEAGGIIINKEGEYEIIRFSDGTIRWAFANTSPGWNCINTGVVAPLNQWTHVAVVYESGIVKTYINGVLVHTHNGSGPIGDYDITRNEFWIGGRQVLSEHFQGRIDEVQVYNRAISASEITALMGN